jgi:N-methylhydantoinase A
MSHRLAVDVGGTFIDFALYDEDEGTLVMEKQPATPATLVKELVDGLDRLPVSIRDVGRLFHGTNQSEVM